MKSQLSQIEQAIRKARNPKKAIVLQRFFKTAPGEYGAGDVFYGLTVPISRKIARTYRALSFTDIRTLLASPIHEKRLIALLILVDRYQHGDTQMQKTVFDFYLKHIARINNWDLVDTSADKIVGAQLFKSSSAPLLTFARSKNLWERRIAILSTFYFIRQNIFEPTLAVVEFLLQDTHDLIHKACGWMLREVGKRDKSVVLDFLREHKDRMPRTMLRYAIERFTPAEKKRLMYT
jgi:3-methyladenine DNA glycosylase AlkD